MNTIFEVIPDISQAQVTIIGYTDKISVEQGGTIQFFVSIRGVNPLTPDEFTLQISREEENLIPVTTLQGTSYEQPTNPDPAVNGCGWQSSITWVVAPHDPSEPPYKSGVYRATLIHGNDSMYFWFIVKSANPGINTKILYVASVNTWQAYNNFDGYDQNGNWIFKNLYKGPDGSYETRARQVSFNRPFIYTGFDYFEITFIKWFYKAKRLGQLGDTMELDFCTSIDIHENPNNFVSFYKLILSIGHDEYWSWEMRDTIETFVRLGGNVAFFSGNVCWWQVRLDDDGQGNHFRTLKCYKEIQQPDGTYSPGEDPYLTDPDPQIRRHTTSNWFDVLPNRPENVMTGASYYWGTALLDSFNTSYVARLYKHWLFKGANITSGHTFGTSQFSGMFETDAGDFEDNDRGFPIPTGKNAYGFSAPKDLVILATADLSHIGDNHQGPDFGYWSGPNYHNGWGTMGIFRNPTAVTNGFVFHGGNFNWASQGLSEYVNSSNWNEFCWMTKNVFEILSIDFQPQALLLDNAYFETGDLTGWTQSVNGTALIVSPGYGGSNFCVKINGSNGEAFLSQKYIPIRTNRPFRIKCFAKPDNGVLSSKSISIRLETLDVNNKPVKEFITATYPISGTDWQEISAEGSLVLSNNADIMAQVRVKLQVATGQIGYFDNVIVEEMP